MATNIEDDFAAIEEQTAERPQNAALSGTPVDEQGPRPGAPLLTLGEIIRPTETVRIGGALHELKYLFDYSLGRQISLINDRNAQLRYLRREENGDVLTPDEEREQRFFLWRISRACLPSLTEDYLSGKENDAETRERTGQFWAIRPLSDSELEAIATLFFKRSEEIREQSSAAGTASPQI